jgi:hypothetical protein
MVINYGWKIFPEQRILMKFIAQLTFKSNGWRRRWEPVKGIYVECRAGDAGTRRVHPQRGRRPPIAVLGNRTGNGGTLLMLAFTLISYLNLCEPGCRLQPAGFITKLGGEFRYIYKPWL